MALASMQIGGELVVTTGRDITQSGLIEAGSIDLAAGGIETLLRAQREALAG